MRNLWRPKGTRNADDASVVVVGVVYPPGATGGQTPPATRWTLRFALEPWRQIGGDIDERRLSVSKRVSEKRLRKYMRRIQPYDVVRAHVRFDDERSGTLLRFVGEDTSDEELARRATEMRQPVTMEVDFFGTLTLDRTVDWWEAEQVWRGSSIRLSISPEEDDDVETVAKTAEALWSNQVDWDQRVRTRAINELLGLKNESWRDASEPPVTAEQFAGRMKLDSVSVGPKGAFEFWFNDDGLFLGHSIRVSGTLAEGPAEADIAG
jgi:hypothetical protein